MKVRTGVAYTAAPVRVDISLYCLQILEQESSGDIAQTPAAHFSDLSQDDVHDPNNRFLEMWFKSLDEEAGHDLRRRGYLREQEASNSHATA